MNHEQKVNEISAQIKSIGGNENRNIKISKSSVSHFVPNPLSKKVCVKKIDIKNLNEILQIDSDKRICIAEPGVTFSDLIKKALEHNLIPYTVPELKTITVGGAVSGCSVESMSYKYGGFHDSCLEYEFVDGTGVIHNCTCKNNSNIFHMLHGSYGTLGIITKIAFKLQPSKSFVKMKYVRFVRFDQFWEFLKERVNDGDYDFIDAIIHSPKMLIVCLGTLVDNAPYTNTYCRQNIFYKSTAERKEDYLTTYDYFFRYDTECHWLSKTVPFMETKLARKLFGKLILGSTNMIKWSNRLRPLLRLKKRPDVVVDVFIPGRNMTDFNKWYENEFNFYPVWVVPYKMKEAYPWINNSYAQAIDDKFLIDWAVYGKPNCEKDIDYSKILEEKTLEMNGIKTLISRNHFDKETFWKVYNENNYYTAKKKTDPQGIFNDLYEKFRPNDQVNKF